MLFPKPTRGQGTAKNSPTQKKKDKEANKYEGPAKIEEKIRQAEQQALDVRTWHVYPHNTIILRSGFELR